MDFSVVYINLFKKIIDNDDHDDNDDNDNYRNMIAMFASVENEAVWWGCTI